MHLTGLLRMAIGRAYIYIILTLTCIISLAYYLPDESAYRDVAEAFIESSQWEVALDSITFTRSGRKTTPLRKLIKKMPGIYIFIVCVCVCVCVYM